MIAHFYSGLKAALDAKKTEGGEWFRYPDFLFFCPNRL